MNMSNTMPTPSRSEIHAKHGGCCAYCGREIPSKGFHVDHREPCYRGCDGEPHHRDPNSYTLDEWNLWLRLPGRKKGRVIATAWANGTWHTWDRDGIGGENDREPSLRRAKEIATGAAVLQGFI